MNAVNNEQLRQELLAMAAEDQRVRQELVEEGTLFDGYHPRMAAVHSRNAARLLALIDNSGWPSADAVGQDGLDAAFRVVQHAIGTPALQRHCLPLFRELAGLGQVPWPWVALLQDRILFFEGKPQIYGTQFDWDEHGEMSPWQIDHPEQVNERRAALGLGTLEDAVVKVREDLAKENPRPPADLAARRAEMDTWARQTGWRS